MHSKILGSILIGLFSMEAHAQQLNSQAVVGNEYNFVCRDYSRTTGLDGSSTVVLTQTQKGKVSDGGPARAFRLDFYRQGDPRSDHMPTWKKSGHVSLEDVSMFFVSDDKNVSFNIYLDELDESTLTLKGASKRDYHCRRSN